MKLGVWYLFLLGLIDAQRITKYNKEAYERLKSQIPSVKKSCGEVCDQSIEGIPGKYFDFVEKKIDCPALFSNPDFDVASIFPRPPKDIPKWLHDDFTYQDRVQVVDEYMPNDVHGQFNIWAYNFSKHYIDDINARLDANTFGGPYGKGDSDKVYRLMKSHLNVKGKHVLVIGSETPWIELMAIKLGAKHVTSIDYAPMKANDHPKISAIHALDFFEMAKKNELPEIDAVISHSSIEHSGLGRYGDNLNPWGDLITMARVWCFLKEGKRALIGLPVSLKGQDTIHFNSGRLYGPLMLSHLFANWKQIHLDAPQRKSSPFCCHHMYVLEK